MKILVIGKNGQLGRSLYKIVCKRKDSKNFIFIGKNQLNLCNTESIRSYFKKNTFNLIINCAAYTDVDQAEVKLKYCKKN